MTAPVVEVRGRGAARWWTYQRERFPLFAHGSLIAAFSFCAVSYSAQLRAADSGPSRTACLIAFVTSFLFFLQLRIADEFKDFDEDARYRPYRPVQRGLVTLRELGVIFVVACVVQGALAAWRDPRLFVLLGVTWGYLALMSKEFFVGAWLRSMPLVYMLTHMVIMPLIDLYATSTEWIAHTSRPPPGLGFFLAASYFNGLVIEIGRKIRSPSDEEHGVQTYSFLWGIRHSTLAWLGAALASGVCGVLASRYTVAPLAVSAVLGLGWIGLCFVAWRFTRRQPSGAGKRIENASGVWTLLLYLSLGLLPLVIR